MRNNSLTGRLFLRIIPILVVTIALIGLLAFRSAYKEINAMYDAQLLNNANVLWMLVEHEFEEPQSKPPKSLKDIDIDGSDQLEFKDDAEDYANERMFRIWKSGKIVMNSDTAIPPEKLPQLKPGFSTFNDKDDDWRIYTLPIKGTDIDIEVGEKMDLRETLVENILVDLSLPLLILIPILAVLVWVVIGSGLDTIRSLVQQIRNRSPDDLSSLEMDHLPSDLAPLAKSINQLLSKLQHSLTAERRFADHAAHQLRTPLAGLKLQLQMLAKADDPSERAAIIQDLLGSNERASHLVGQLLNAARVSHQTVILQSVNLYESAASVIAELGILANQKQIDIALEGDERAHVKADEGLLRLLLFNVIENAVKYTPNQGVIRIMIASIIDMWRISISDSGPGIPEAERELVFQHFYRIGTMGTEGSGLGLAIAADIVQRFSGEIILKSAHSGHGLLVEIDLPKI